jgi:hypothetical protein
LHQFSEGLNINESFIWSRIKLKGEFWTEGGRRCWVVMLNLIVFSVPFCPLQRSLRKWKPLVCSSSSFPFFFYFFLFFKLKRSKVILWTTRGNICTNPLHLLILIIFFFFGHEKSSFCLDSAFRYQSSIIFVEIYTF